MSNSLLNGTNWHWRQGLKPMPIHSSVDDSDVCMTRELCMSAQTLVQAQNIIEELKQNGITSKMKKTHSSYGVVPPGTLIVYAELTDDVGTKEQKENIEKLKTYILGNGGKIGESAQKNSFIRHFMQNLFGRK